MQEATQEQSLAQAAIEENVNDAAQAAAESETPRVEVMPSAEELLRAARLEAEEHRDAWLRAKAETENVRRRAQEDITKAHKYAAEKFAESMLPVKDSL